MDVRAQWHVFVRSCDFCHADTRDGRFLFCVPTAAICERCVKVIRQRVKLQGKKRLPSPRN